MNDLNDHLNIYVDRLRMGQQHEIDEVLPPDFLDVHDQNLSYNDDVTVEGEAYLAEDTLVVHFTTETTACLPCSICNEPVTVPIRLENCYHTENLADIKGAVKGALAAKAR